jgi:ATP/maltotriose-dependent transcriptional regulator MalT
VYISAVAGWGKNAAVKYYYENKPVLVLIGSASFPQWMSEFMLQYDFLRIGEKNLQFGIDEIAEYMKKKALALTDEDLAEVIKNTHGYPPMAVIINCVNIIWGCQNFQLQAICRH